MKKQEADRSRGGGGRGPWHGLQGAEPSWVGKFCISVLNLCDLVHAFLTHINRKSLDPFDFFVMLSL